MFDLFLPKHVKRGKRVLETVKKFVAYNRDLMSPEKLESVLRAKDDYNAALQTRNKDSMKAAEDELVKICDASLPSYKNDPIRENLEVIVVAIVVALGVRAYLVQPFKIPTKSMQPTLNGLIGTAVPTSEPKPNIVQNLWDFVWRGSNFTELKAPAVSGDLRIVRIEQKSFLKMFFTRTTVYFSNGQTEGCYAPARQLLSSLWVGGSAPFGEDQLPVEDFNQQVSIPVSRGTVLARGRVASGDHLLVDKASYHFRQPNRGEVFVFNTVGLKTDAMHLSRVARPYNEVPAQHYIKRLVGVPNDQLMVVKPNLLVNGKPATEPKIAKVMAHEGNPEMSPNINKLHGYLEVAASSNQFQGNSETVIVDGRPVTQYNLGPHDYFAMGDNSGHSSDSRYWGPVPEQNLVGPAWVVYWPFAPHWGFVK
jgi:signal peptidase I